MLIESRYLLYLHISLQSLIRLQRLSVQLLFHLAHLIELLQLPLFEIVNLSPQLVTVVLSLVLLLQLPVLFNLVQCLNAVLEYIAIRLLLNLGYLLVHLPFLHLVPV